MIKGRIIISEKKIKREKNSKINLYVKKTD